MILMFIINISHNSLPVMVGFKLNDIYESITVFISFLQENLMYLSRVQCIKAFDIFAVLSTLEGLMSRLSVEV